MGSCPYGPRLTTLVIRSQFNAGTKPAHQSKLAPRSPQTRTRLFVSTEPAARDQEEGTRRGFPFLLHCCAPRLPARRFAAEIDCTPV
jgi:hypothetical protein